MTEYSRYEQAAETAKGRGLVVAAPAPNELFVDIDDEESMEVYRKNFQKIDELGIVDFARVNPSPSGRKGRYHVVVRLNRDVTSSFERIALQALLGSDRTREVLSWQRAVRGDPVPTLFFEKPSKATPELSAPKPVSLDDELAF